MGQYSSTQAFTYIHMYTRITTGKRLTEKRFTKEALYYGNAVTNPHGSYVLYHSFREFVNYSRMDVTCSMLRTASSTGRAIDS